jgi:hypothetical protein
MRKFIGSFIIGCCLALTITNATAESKEKPATLEALLTDKASQYINALEEITKQYAPDVVNGALVVVQLSGVGEIAPALLYGLVFPLCVWWFFWFFNQKPKTETYHEKRWDYYEPGPQIIGGSVIFVGGILWIAAVCIVLDIWNWIRIFEPKLWIAYKILEKLL